jgi:uncharacterized membrane protein
MLPAQLITIVLILGLALMESVLWIPALHATGRGTVPVIYLITLQNL